ncbi:hypothetical protein [Shewanella nanhaiensis]|uniref:Uncharacterized protein n=1 Tax=Shewanella nanhaiensis TaxID=2864872 RepID=A0ABS7E2P8_9GAMM|nr:hypothetical protein [Shewanella nanhaiensis]MBW8183436.1 hypothetical protein [Shewanella nanhaiensis]
MRILFTISLILSSFALLAQPDNRESYTQEEMVFIQSVMYQPLAKFCARKTGETEYQKWFKEWHRGNQGAITQGSEDFTNTVLSNGEQVERVVNMLIHQVEADWGGSDQANQTEKCLQLKSLFRS